MDIKTTDSDWKIQERPPHMTRSVEFTTYSELRQFLDDLANLSEKVDLYPNLNFTQTRVNINIESDTEKLGDREFKFAEQTDVLLSQQIVKEVLV